MRKTPTTQIREIAVDLFAQQRVLRSLARRSDQQTARKPQYHLRCARELPRPALHLRTEDLAHKTPTLSRSHPEQLPRVHLPRE